MLTKKQNLTREILTVILLLAAVAATEYWFFQLWRLDWHVPMFYGGDGIYWVGQVQRSYGELSGSLGWPFYEVAGRYDPNYDLIYDIFVWFVGLFTKDTGTVFNLYVLVIPFANALAGYAVFRMVGLEKIDAMITACEENRVKLSCIFNNRYREGNAFLKRAIEQGRFGSMLSASAPTHTWFLLTIPNRPRAARVSMP